ncbi:MAG: hypothetical protein NUW22_12585 [Acidobacteria bacterium]|nr:hypothetical protein [Acidobacteriota bacterium]
MEFFAGTETDTLYPFGGDQYWIAVKRELTAGEDRALAHAAIGRGTREVGPDGQPTNEVGFALDLDKAAFKKVALYLHEWNLTDRQKRVVDIGTEAKKVAALRNLKPPQFRAIEVAIDAYVLERLIEKKVPSGSDGSTAPSAP